MDIGSIHLDTTSSLAIEVFVTAERSETPVLGDDNLLATGELVLRTSEGLKGEVTVYSLLVWDCFHPRVAGDSRIYILESRVRTLMMI